MGTRKKPNVGGQAVIEGVMMRGPKSWAIAVRKPDYQIVCETYPLPGHADRHRWLRLPLIRGVYVLVESLVVGVRALMISANHSLGEEERLSERQLGWSLAGALLLFTGIFIVAPALVSKAGGRLAGLESDLLENAVEGILRLGLFIGYIFLISLVPDIRRVFQYHGAEHKTIYAYENDDPLEPEIVDRYSTLHVRCGTNFLFIVLFLAIAVHFLMDLALPRSIPLRISARIGVIPLLAGVAYEVIKGASRNETSLIFRIASLPGLALQRITTRPPTREQIEVAIKAMESVIAREKLTEPAPELREERAAAERPAPRARPESGTAAPA
jgi:uncharacterized protein YqhQ